MMKKRRFSLNMNDITVRNKLLLLYILCVFIPIIFINLAFYNMISKRVQEQGLKNFNLSLDRIKSNIIKQIGDCVGVSNTICSDTTLNNDLEHTYADPRELFIKYQSSLQNALEKYLATYSQIKNIYIYTDNDTIRNAGTYRYIDSDVKQMEWYKLVKDTYGLIQVYPYIDQSINSHQDRMVFSIVRRMNVLGRMDSVQKMIKIDLKYDFLSEVVKSEKLNIDIFIVNNLDQILYSTNNSYMDTLYRSFLPFSLVKHDEDSITLERPFDNIRYMKGWKVIAVIPEKRILEDLRGSSYFIAVIAGVCLLLSTAIILVISRSFSVRLKMLSKHMDKVRRQEFDVTDCEEGNDEIGQLITDFNTMTIKIKELIQDVYEAQIQKDALELERKQAELNALQSQINPHFLYNTLNTIRIRCVLKNETETAEIIKCLSSALRRIVKWGNDSVTVKEEIEFVEDFLKIQKYRFAEKIDYTISVDENALDCKIPKMSIQTFVENSCVHGIERVKTKGHILVEVVIIDGVLQCTIEDNGIGMEPQKLNEIIAHLGEKNTTGENIGLGNIYNRLLGLYGKELYFDIKSSKNVGTKVCFRIPLEA